MAKVYADSITLFEGNYYNLVFSADYSLIAGVNNLGLQVEKVNEYAFRFYGYVAVEARTEPYYITLIKDPNSEEGEDVNIKVFVANYDGAYKELGL